MARRKRINQKPGSKASPSAISAGRVNQERVEVEDEEAGEDLSQVPGSQTKFEVNVESRSWVVEAEEQEFQELAKDKWSRFQDTFAARGGVRLNYEEPLIRDGQLIAQVDKEEIEVEASFWQSAMVCVVLGANPPLSVFEGFINRMWGKLGIERIARMNGGYTLVKFKDEVTRDLVLEAGVVHFDRKPVLLRPWSTDLDKVRLVKSVPVWVRLPDLGLQYWGLKTLSALVSTIGKPMMMDKVTKDKSMVKFSRVLVDVEISDKIPQCISFLNEKGQLMEQPIEFEWLPTRCSCCKNLGHGASNCKRSQEVQWKPKQVVNNAGIEDSDVSKIQSEAGLVDGSIGTQMAGKDSQQGKTGSTLASTRELKTGIDSRDLSIQDTGNASVEQDLSWSTPKRVGGVKLKTAANVTVRGNKFSLLQESKEMVKKKEFT
ncbi:uncharacterized protein LOC133825453 [Humulus lupulus]|uniref:uncharacterized protein LOC133825453 n=1 Tax=Humulus lupulus TaxID=3486 RepID=UPI002B40ADD6|nr:uncharacterized protein LOC133825453 [Humulus lupulus]